MNCQMLFKFKKIILRDLRPRNCSQKITDTKMASNQCVVAVCQMTSSNNKDENLKVVECMITRAKNSNAKMVFLPEACDYVGLTRNETMTLAERLNGRLMKAYKKLALTNNLWLSIGGFHEVPEKPLSEGRVYNTHVLINNKGKIVTTYRKLHLFDVVLPERNLDLRESKTVCPGPNLVDPVNTPAGKLALSICYDVRFPELSTALRKMDAAILTYPSAFTHATGEAHWETLLRARAIENQCYVVAAAQAGIHNPTRMSHGRAMIIDPWGKILVQCPKFSRYYAETSCVGTATIDKKIVTNIRHQMPIFNHRRDDVYSLTINDKLKNYRFVDMKFADKIISSNTIFYQTKFSFAFTNIKCVLPGHVLVSSKRVTPRLQNLSPEEIADLFQTTVIVQKVVESVHGSNSSTIVIQDGKDAGQTVPHVHCHILPRQPGDFERNDDVYDALAKHESEGATSQIREITEMVDEAAHLRPLFAEPKSI